MYLILLFELSTCFIKKVSKIKVLQLLKLKRILIFELANVVCAYYLKISMSKISNVFHYLSVLPRTWRRLNRVNGILDEIVKAAEKEEAWRLILNQKGFKMRLTQYVQVHSLLDMSLCGLAGREITDEELVSCVCFCACLPLFDDFFDEQNMDAKQIKQLIHTPGEVVLADPKAALFLHFFKQIKLKNEQLFAEFFEQLFWAQEESKRLLVERLDDDAVLKIAFEKGGYSALCFRAVLQHEFVDGEEVMLYQLGAVGQLMDDLFDLHDDYLEGVKTYALNNSEKVDEVANHYFKEIDALKKMVFNLPVQEVEKKRFWRELILMINGGVLCAHQYIDVKNKYGEFDIAKLSRKEVICDMEDKSNWWRMVKLSIADD